jgi:hypothetical protein
MVRNANCRQTAKGRDVTPIAGPEPPSDEVERAPDEAPEYDVFLAYNSQDEVAVDSAKVIFDALEANGRKVWYDRKDAVVGDRSDEIMVGGIERSRTCAMLHGPHGLGRWQKGFELSLALQRSIDDPTTRVFAVLLPGSEGHKTLPKGLQFQHILNLTEGFTDRGLSDDGLRELVAAVEGKSLREMEEAREAHDVGPAGDLPEAGPRKSRALLVSVSKYVDQKLRDLHGPPFDAHELQAALEGARMARGSEWQVTPCAEPDIDTLGKNLQEFFLDEDLRGGTALFFYSGHGVVHSGDSYVCATDTDTTSISWTAMPATRIVDLVRKCPAQSKVIILDCCHAATIVSSAYETLGDDVAVVLASRGQAEDAPVSGPSPFTSGVVEAFGDARTDAERPLTIGHLLEALGRHGERPWTNSSFAGDIVLAARAERAEPPPKERDPAISIRVAPADPTDVRLPLVRQLAATLDGLLAIAREERQVPTSTVRDTMYVLAEELRRLTGDQLHDLEAVLQLAPDELPKTCAVSFAEGATGEIVELPWEYLGLCGSERRGAPMISIERLFEAPVTKYAGTQEIQKVVLFSSLEAGAEESVHPLTAATQAQLELSPEDVVPRAKWSQFTGAPDADVVALQAPVWLKDGNLKVVFAGPRAGEPNDVDAVHAKTFLQQRPALSWLLIETIADDPHYRSALAVRKLADYLASQAKRPVVALCHSPAYLTALRENPNATTFLGQLIDKLRARWPLDHAAYAARESVVSSLGLNDSSIIGFPVVLRPVERTAPVSERPAARR